MINFEIIETTREATIGQWIYRITEEKNGVFIKRIRSKVSKYSISWGSPFIQVWNGKTFSVAMGIDGHAINVGSLENALDICSVNV